MNEPEFSVLKVSHRYLPYEKFTVEYFGNVNDVYSKLISIIETDFQKRQPKNSVFNWQVESNKKFGGVIHEGVFNIERLTHPHQNSFRPLISGKFTANVDKTQIEVIQKLPLHIAVLSAIIFLGAVFGSIIVIIYEFLDNNYFAPFLTLLFPIAVYAMVLGGFKYESKIFRSSLSQVLNS